MTDTPEIPTFALTDEWPVDTFDVGAAWGTPVSPTHHPPFAFTGTVRQMTVEAK